MGVFENQSNFSSGQGPENPLAGCGGLHTLVEELIWDKLLHSFFLFLLHRP